MKLSLETTAFPEVTGAVRALAFDRDGFLWAGTSAGLFVYDAHEWRAVDLIPHAPSSDVRALLAHSDGSLWAGTLGGGVLRRLAGEWVRYDAGSGLRDDRVTCLLEAVGRDGAPVVWAGTHAGLARFQDRGGWTVFDESAGMPANEVTCMVVSASATGNRVLWIGTPRGLARFERTHWAVFNDTTGLPSAQVLSLAIGEGEYGKVLWAGTSGGLVRSERRQWYRVAPPEIEGARVTALAGATSPGGGRALWAGTDNRGVLLYDGGAWRALDGLPPGAVLCITSDDARRLVWVGTSEGLVMISLGDDPHPAPRPLRISRVLVNDAEISLPHRAALPEGATSVAFEYALLDFAARGRTRYRTQVAGLEKRPTEWTSERRRELTGLAPGTYELRVWARDRDGVEVGPERRAFRVVPPKRRTWWASALFAGAAAGLAYGALRYGSKPVPEDRPSDEPSGETP